MHKVKHEHNPEVYERRIFPMKPSRPVSPASSRLSTGALSRHTRRATEGERPHVLTAHGIEYIREPGPALHPGLRSKSQSLPRQIDGAASSAQLRSDMAGLDKTHRRHVYHSNHEFGHHSVANNVNPFLAHYQLPKWETTSNNYGVHYKHPEQTFTRPMRNRMPVFHINL
mmetsp:Transcript_66269/g.167956  ORF Transcript_66269/g.167956 Transcript_66269/m.167956 type:complete len:170 (+) Transcript_66269:185-694(+)